MDELDSRAPLLSSSPGSSWDDDNDDRRASYGSASPGKDNITVTLSPRDADEDAQRTAEIQGGVQQADAINLVWSRPALVTAYCFIFLCSFANSLQWQIMTNLMPYVVSEFSSHSLIPTIGIVASILSGVLKLPVAKMIDSWGRPQGLASMITLATFGLVLMAASSNVRAYAAAQVIYQVGISGFTYVLEIIIADTSSLKSRTLAFAFNASPNIITTFIGPVIARAFYERSNWRVAFGLSAALFFTCSLPILSILALNMRRARLAGILQSASKAGPWSRRRSYRYLVDSDALGLLLLSMGMTLILVPFSLANSNATTTRLDSHMLTIILGFASLIAFGIHERKTSRPFMNFSLFFSPNIAGACLLSVAIFVAYFSWDGYYSSYLQVVHDLSITQAGYIGQVYSVGSGIWAAVVGYLIRRSDRFKWLAWAALPIHILSGLLLIIFRRPDTHVAWLVVAQIVGTIGGSTLVVCNQMAVMVVANHAELASVLALLSLSAYIGSAIGSSLSGAIWNGTLPEALAELLPQLAPDELALIASDLRKQLSYPMGDPIREAIIAAYDRSQVRMCITGFLVTLVEIVAVAMWKDSRVSQSKQVKGTVL